jgi:hypothetical protein
MEIISPGFEDYIRLPGEQGAQGTVSITGDTEGRNIQDAFAK